MSKLAICAAWIAALPLASAQTTAEYVSPDGALRAVVAKHPRRRVDHFDSDFFRQSAADPQ